MARPAWIHLTARLVAGAPDLCREDTGGWLWERLRSVFAGAIAVTLMPDHPHVLVVSADPQASAQRLARLLGQFGRRFGVRGQVSEVPAPASIRGGDVLARQVRYIALNPCRAGLVRCPLAWRWSTHRDVVGATVDPWVTAERLAAALGVSPRGFAARHHAYVSSDPCTAVDGTPMPRPAPSTTTPTIPLSILARAAAAATRAPLDALQRRGPTRALFVALAYDQGWSFSARLAQVCGCCPQTIRNLAVGCDPAGLQAARLCLGDARLRGGATTTRRDPPFERRGRGA